MQVDITSHNVQKLQLATKVDDAGDLIVKISAESKIHPADVARLLYLQKNKAPLYFSVGSMQATMDLEMVTIKSEKVDKPAAAPAPAPDPTLTPAETVLADGLFKAEVVVPQPPSGNGSGPTPKRRRSKKTAAAPETTPV